MMDNLLAIRYNRPWKQKNGPGYGYFRDLVIFYFYVEKNNADVYINGKYYYDITRRQAIDMINEIKAQRKKQTKLYESNKTVIWVNSLKLFQSEFEGYEHSIFMRRGVKTISNIYDDEVEIRNFDVISNEDNVFNLAKSLGIDVKTKQVDIMRLYFKMLNDNGLEGWWKINYSYAHCMKRIFSKGLKGDDKLRRLNSIPNMETYKLIQRANKAGGIGFIKDYKKKLITNVSGRDISSAYPGQFVRQKMPIGKFRAASNLFQEWIKAKKEDKAYLLEVFTDKEIDCAGLIRYDEKKDKYVYVFTDWDIKIIDLFGIKLNDYGAFLNKLYIADEKDYLDYNLRQRFVQYYDEKQKYKNVNPEAYFVKKTALDIQYGKGIQNHEFEKGGDIYTKYKYEHILPQWSLWACAATRYELALGLLNTNPIAWDTDGIKFFTEMKNDFFERRNEELKELNRLAGFKSDIGTWKDEGCYDYFMQIARKVYAYYKDGEFKCVFAGCCKPAWVMYFKDMELIDRFKDMAAPHFFIPSEYLPKVEYVLIDGEVKIKSYHYSPGVEDNV